MSTFKIQKIRSCEQCGDVLSLKCKSCVSHPERVPRVVEYYDWPQILQTGHCGCIQIRCQSEGCVNTMWRDPKHYGAAGKATSKRFFCSIGCSGRSMALARITRQEVPCAYCTKKVVKKSYALKIWKQSFCNNTCYFLFRAKNKHEERENKVAEKNGSDGSALYYCSVCRDVTNQSQFSGFLRASPIYKCSVCLSSNQSSSVQSSFV